MASLLEARLKIRAQQREYVVIAQQEQWPESGAFESLLACILKTENNTYTVPHVLSKWWSTNAEHPNL